MDEVHQSKPNCMIQVKNQVNLLQCHCDSETNLARYVGDMSPTCRRHVHMSPISCRHCMSIRHGEGPDICSFCQKLPTPPQNHASEEDKEASRRKSDCYCRRCCRGSCRYRRAACRCLCAACRCRRTASYRAVLWGSWGSHHPGSKSSSFAWV